MEYIRAFLVGGVICAIAQVLIDYTAITPPKIMVGYVVAGVILGSFGVYQPLIEFAGGGASIPLLSFGNSIAKGTIEAIQEKGPLGILSGGLTATSAGIGASIFFGLLVALIFNPKDKT